MSELKRFNVVGKYSDEETMLEYRPDGVCYDADEADKVIAHNKYKRCVAMRNMCRYAQYWYSCLMEIESCKISSNNIDFRKYNNKYHFYLRWRKRWNEFAEKFKEAKLCVTFIKT